MGASMQPGWSAALWFVAVVAAIPLVLWLLKRTPLGAAGSGAPGTPRSVAVLPLSAQHKLVTVEMGHGEDKLWLVMGVSPQGLNVVHTMAAGVAGGSGASGTGESENVARPAATFAQLLSRLRGKDGGGV
jgi:flagellar protein FliO/FliZ